MGKVVKKLTGGLIDTTTPNVEAQQAPAAAAAVEVSKATADQGDTDKKVTEKQTQARGKKELTVSKNSGKGVNI